MRRYLLVFFMLVAMLMSCGQDGSINTAQEMEEEDEDLEEDDEMEEEETEEEEEEIEEGTEEEEEQASDGEDGTQEEEEIGDEEKQEEIKEEPKEETKEEEEVGKTKEEGNAQEEALEEEKKEEPVEKPVEETKEEPKEEPEEEIREKTEKEKERKARENMARGIYSELVRRLERYRVELGRDKSVFIAGNHSFPVLVNKLKGIRSSYADPEEMNKIYAGLGYDVDSIRKLEESFPGVVVSMFGNQSGTVFIVASFLKLFVDIDTYTQKILNEALGNSNLANARSVKDPSILNSVGHKMGEFIRKREELLGKIKACLSIMEANKHNKAFVYGEMQKMTDGSLSLSADCERLGKISEDIKKLIQSS
ncbi:hypothetical protein [Borrelia sp. RT5S]|uniref:hypothetical protein n=1 Tax=Borrelia sp. RT5S TaxID=2898581 RepID=UPI001E2D13B9|nr:hypothetical protein [Borrelia sp. RT5S]UGQ16775.1 hypothetical protein LSO06_05490 [Borrelia sp. RT5S]